MATLRGSHRQRFTQREFNYWAAYQAVGNMMSYSAVVKEGDQPLDMPDAQFWFNAREADAEQAVRAHLLQYLDATRFGAGQALAPPASDAPSPEAGQAGRAG